MKKELVLLMAVCWSVQLNFGQNQSNALLYLKVGSPSNWVGTGAQGRAEEISRWTNAGYIVTPLDFSQTTVTEELLNNYNVLRVDGYACYRAISSAEGLAIYYWVMSGGKLMADIMCANQVPAVSLFGVQNIEGQNGGSSGLSWYFHGAPFLTGPVTGPGGTANSLALEAMDHPVLSSNHNLIIDGTISGYPMVVHNQFGNGKAIIIFTGGWCQNAAPPGNAYQANIFQADNLQFLSNCIQYLSANSSNQNGNISSAFIFDTRPPVVSLLNPNGGQTFSGNQTVTVNWTANDEQIASNPVSISMTGYQNGTYQTLQQNLPNSGTANVLPMSISTRYAKMKVNVKDKYGNIGSDVSDGTFTVTTAGFTSLTADFNFSPLQPIAGQTVIFTDASTGTPGPSTWLWVFSDGICNNVKNPTHVFSKQGTYTVTLKVGNGTGTFNTKTKTVHVGPVNYGIRVEIKETGTPDVVGFVGFKGSDQEYFPVIHENGKRMAHITFLGPKANDHGMKKNILYLYQQDGNQKKQVGHIAFEYNPEKEYGFQRNAYIFFHNDAAMCTNASPPGKPFFPYSKNSPEYKPGWEYYKFGEYPVSMLIPPNNVFKDQSNLKQPLLFIHGWEGTYCHKENPDAKPEWDETSYWFTTVETINDPDFSNSFEAWQFYYPYNTGITHISYCFDKATQYLKYSLYPQKKLGIITHSMGSLPTAKYITDNPSEAQNRIVKIFFTGPPLHGSYGANIYYDNLNPLLGALLSPVYESAKLLFQTLLGYDAQAPAVRDMKHASDLIWDIQNDPWPDLNNSGGLDDDYFVLIGTTPSRYIGDGVFPSAKSHHDGIVAVSSASLLDKNIGFMTVHGNHNDMVHAQSKKRNCISKQNIGDSLFLPMIIKNYFTLGYADFLTDISTNTDQLYEHIKAVVNGMGVVVKPQESQINLSNLNTPGYITGGEDDVIYQRGILNFDLNKNTLVNDYSAWYNSTTKTLRLYPYLPGGTNVLPAGSQLKGSFQRNKTTSTAIRYYFEGSVLNPALLGSAIDLLAGTNNIVIYNQLLQPIKNLSGTFNYNHCTSTLLNLPADLNAPSTDDSTNNQTDSKIDSIVALGQPISGSLKTFIHIDTEATLGRFDLSSIYAADHQISLVLKLKRPDGVIIDSTFSGGQYSKDLISGLYEIKIQNPMAGKWLVWAESGFPGIDTVPYTVAGYIMSDLYAYIINDTSDATVGENFQIIAGLEMDTLSLADSLSVIATVTMPDGDTAVYDITSSKLAIDSAFRFSGSFAVDTAGYYNIKINLDGVYNSYRFERVIFHGFQASDTIVHLSLPDVVLRQYNDNASVDLRRFAYNYPCSYDSLSFVAEVISYSTASSTIAFNVVDSTGTIEFSSNLTDTCTLQLKVTMFMPGQSVSDTMLVAVKLADIHVFNAFLDISEVLTDSSVVATSYLANTGNHYAQLFQYKYFLSADTILSSEDPVIHASIIHSLDPDSVVTITDTLTIPSLMAQGPCFVLFAADPDTSIRELNDSTNNLTSVPITINRLPVVTVRFFPEGLYNTAKGRLNKARDINADKYPGNIADLATVLLADEYPPYQILETFTDVPIDTNGMASVTIPPYRTFPCYLVIKHRNTLETWSMVPVAFDSLAINYDFTQNPNASFGGNLKNSGANYLLYSGDINQDGAIDAKDLIMVGNDKASGVTGYTLTDLNGDAVVNEADVQMLQGNASEFIMRKKPE